MEQRKGGYPTAKPDEFKINQRWLHLMPEIGGEDAEGMIQSIKRAGVLKPIEVLPDMTIIDGYQRHRTVENNPEVPQDIPYEIKTDLIDKDEKEVEEYMVTINFQRRNLSGYPRAVAATNIAELWGWFGEAEERMKAGVKIEEDPCEESSQGFKGRTTRRIAKHFKVNEKAVELYLTIKKRAAETGDTEELSKLWDLHMKLFAGKESIEGAKKKLGKKSKSKDTKKKGIGPSLRASRVFDNGDISELWEWIKDRFNEFKEKLGVVDEFEVKLKASSHDRELMRRTSK